MEKMMKRKIDWWWDVVFWIIILMLFVLGIYSLFRGTLW